MRGIPVYSLMLGLILLAGCRTLSSQSVDGHGLNHRILPSVIHYLDTPENQSLRLHQFLNGRTSLEESDKIRYLLSAIQSSPYTFVRNGAVYEPTQAMRWLRWKMGHAQYRAHPIRTAHDFVNRAANRSLATGQPYQVILPDQSRQPLQELLSHELEALESASLKHFFQASMTHQNTSAPAETSDYSAIKLAPSLISLSN